MNYIVWVRRIQPKSSNVVGYPASRRVPRAGIFARSSHKMGYSVEGPGRGMAVGPLEEFDASSLA